MTRFLYVESLTRGHAVLFGGEGIVDALPTCWAGDNLPIFAAFRPQTFYNGPPFCDSCGITEKCSPLVVIDDEFCVCKDCLGEWK